MTFTTVWNTMKIKYGTSNNNNKKTDKQIRIIT